MTALLLPKMYFFPRQHQTNQMYNTLWINLTYLTIQGVFKEEKTLTVCIWQVRAYFVQPDYWQDNYTALLPGFLPVSEDISHR